MDQYVFYISVLKFVKCLTLKFVENDRRRQPNTYFETVLCT